MRIDIDSVKKKLRGRRKPRILVVGDMMLDEYIWGSVERVSPEAPVQVVKVKKKESVPGGAANVVNNLASLGAVVSVAGIIGNDIKGRILRDLLKKQGIKLSSLISSKDVATITKTRVIAHNQQILRVDEESDTPFDSAQKKKMFSAIRKNIKNADGVILSDYNKGTLDEETAQKIIKLANSLGKKVIVDPKGRDYTKYRGAHIVTPNLKELEESSGVKCDSEKKITAAISASIKKIKCGGMLVTRGSDGMTLLIKNGKKVNFKSCALEVYDVSGAGDTVIATFSFSLFSGLSPDVSAMISNTSGGIVVEKVGTAVVTVNEILSRLDGEGIGAGIIEEPHIESSVMKLRRKGKKIVFTNGCFDILHMGHIYLLQQAKSFGDVLIVGINTDASIKRLKGNKRPLIGEEQRAKLLSALSCVDYVTFFDEDTPMELIKKIRPHILVKGGDYRKNEVVGADFTEKNGGRVELVKVVEGLSTTNLITRIVNQYK